jgi:hypothetical protein
MRHQPRPPILLRFSVLLKSTLLCFLFVGSMEVCGVVVTNSSNTVQSQATLTTQGQPPQQPPANSGNNYQQATSGTPALSDPLTGSDGNQWDTQSMTGTGQCTFESNSYQVSESQVGAEAVCLERATSFSNFTAQVQVTLHSGDTAGLVVRANSSGGTTSMYVFGVNANRGYGFGLYTLSNQNNSQSSSFHMQSTTQGGANAATALKAGFNQSNILTLAAYNNSFDLYINGTYIDTVNDSTLSTGFIGVFAAAQTGVTTGAFSMMQVWAH